MKTIITTKNFTALLRILDTAKNKFNAALRRISRLKHRLEVARHNESELIKQRERLYLTLDAQDAREGVLIKQRDEARLHAATLNAMLCQLRVYQNTKHQRTGWAVTAFIPNAVLEKAVNFPGMRQSIEREVVLNLVKYAFNGIWEVVSGRLKSIAVVYKPVIVTAVDDAGKPLEVEIPTQKAGAPSVILEKDAGDDDPDEPFRAYNPNDSSTWRKQ